MNTLALLGQPNCGKSTLFNGLTGSHQHVGNWPGKTVERSEGEFTVGEKQFHVVDLPGSYSLSANSDEEIITRDYISSGKADAVLIMADASQLTRSLYMLADYIGMETPAILVLNMMDVAKGKGIIIDEKKLGENLGIPVVSMVAADKKTYKELYKKVTGEKIGVVISKSALEEKTAGIDKKNTLALANAKYAWIESVLNGVVTKQKGKSHFGKFDRVATSRVWGKPLAILITLLTFVGGFILATPIMMLGQAIPQYLHEPLFNVMTNASVHPILISIVCDLMLNVCYFALSMSGFVLGISFAFNLLEDIGYMARISYLFDGVMTKLGLQGKAVMPMLMGTVCTIGSASGSRVIDNWGQRVLLLAVAWAVPCGATWSLMPTMASMFFGSIGAIGVMIFIVACSFNMPCVMALSATAKEVHSVKWTAKIALFYTVMSLVLAGITYQIANIFL